MTFTLFDESSTPRKVIGHIEVTGKIITNATGQSVRAMRGWHIDSLNDYLKRSGWKKEEGTKWW